MTSFSIVFTVRCFLSRFLLLLQPFPMPGYFQNSRYLVLSAQLEDTKAEAADAKLRGDKSGHTKASKKVRALTLGQYSFCFYSQKLKNVCFRDTVLTCMVVTLVRSAARSDQTGVHWFCSSCASVERQQSLPADPEEWTHTTHTWHSSSACFTFAFS